MTMKKQPKTFALYVYAQDPSGRFWIYAGGVYHRFLWNAAGIFYVREQDYLPEYAVGYCLVFTSEQRDALEWVANERRIKLTFFDSESECAGYAVMAKGEQFVFDQTLPGGYFYL